MMALVLLGSAVGELVCEVTAVGELVCEVSAVGEYAGRPLKAGDAAQPVGCSARFVPGVFGPFQRSRTRNAWFGVRDGGKVQRRTRNELFGVRR